MEDKVMKSLGLMKINDVALSPVVFKATTGHHDHRY
jgi:ribosomal protein L30/L7E